MKAIGIDIGTTSVCGVVIDAESGEVLKSRTKNSNAFLKGCAEWEKIQAPEKMISAATEILDEFIDGDVSVIGITGQMHGIVYLDKNGLAVSPLYTWQDGRGNLPYNGKTYAEHLNSFSGYGNVTDFYNRQNGIRPPDAVSYSTIHDYLAMRLCGLKTPVIHASNAASLGCYDIKTNKFNYDFNGEITADYHILGKYKGIPVSVAIGDNQASVFSCLSSESDVLLNVGTGSQVSVISSSPLTLDNIEARPYFEGKYLIVGSALCGGRAYSLLKNFYADVLSYVKPLEDDEVYSLMSKMLEKTASSSLSVDTRFAGTRTNSAQCGSISGISTENFTAPQLTLGFLNGMAEELFCMYKLMNVSTSGIVGSGNGLRKNSALVKLFEEKFKATMKIPKHLEEASFGAALFGLISCGAMKNAAEAQKIINYN